jgi:hypothetical protein
MVRTGFRGLIALAATQVLGCSAGGASHAVVVGNEGTGGATNGRSGDGGSTIVLTGDAGISKALSAHIESPPGMIVDFITLSCSTACADVVRRGLR